MTIDSHQHFWKYDPVEHAWIDDSMIEIRRDFLPGNLRPLLDQNGVDGCVNIQVSQTEKENTFMLRLAENNPFIKGVVAWVDLRADNLEECLHFYRTNPTVKGFRHIVQGEPRGFLADRRFVNGVKKLKDFGFTYDLLVYHHQLDEAFAFVKEVEGVKIVIDHLAKPSIKTGDIAHWARTMRALAKFENTWCKVSGMVTEASWHDWKVADLLPYMDVVVDAFGARRIMYGSD